MVMKVMRDSQSINTYCTRDSSYVDKPGCLTDPPASVCGFPLSVNLVLCCHKFSMSAWQLTCLVPVGFSWRWHVRPHNVLHSSIASFPKMSRRRKNLVLAVCTCA